MCRLGLILAMVIGLMAAADVRAESLAVAVLESAEESSLLKPEGLVYGYAIVHQARPEDRARLSEWLHTRSGSEVDVMTKDGARHHAVLRRLKHCFGRGLLLYRDRLDLRERDVITLDLGASLKRQKE